jgi:phosphomannomutase
MHAEGSHLGGEQSGHFFCGEDFYDHDDALVAALRILAIFAQKRNVSSRAETRDDSAHHGSSPLTMTRFSSLFSHYPKVYQTPEWRPHCPDEKKGEIIEKITAHFMKKYPCNTMDGVRIDFGDGAWAGIRQSNTSPKISVCMEARSKEKLEEVMKNDPLALIEYWSIDPDYDEETFRSKWQDYRENTDNDGDKFRVIKKVKLEVPKVKGKRKVCVKTVDVFGFESVAVQEVK